MNLEEILLKAYEGKRITEDEALQLLKVESFYDVLKIGIVADKIREKKVGNVVTYVKNRNINYTNICINRCKFCAFRREEKDVDAYVLSIEEILKKVEEAVKCGAKEICIQGGINRKLEFDYYEKMLKEIKKRYNIHIHAFSPMEIYHLSKISGFKIYETLKYLKEIGLDSMPGTAAEILDDEIRKRICPEKIDTKTWIEIIKTAHKLGIKTTATILYGHVESYEHVIRHLSILRKIQDETKGFTEFIPLAFVHKKTELYRKFKSQPGSSSIYDIKLYSVSRIFLDNFRNIQASWVKLGRKMAQLMLNFGANDLGGLLIEENISREAGAVYEFPSEQEIRLLISQIGRIPKERDTLYNLV